MIFDLMAGRRVISFNMLFSEKAGGVIPKGLYCGEGLSGFIEAHARAAAGSAKLHIIPIDRPLERAVQVIPPIYDEIWTAGKGSYKLQRPGVMADGGEIIIFAPHITRFHSNPEMERAIRTIGYHCRDWVIEYLAGHPDFDRNVAAHVINVRGPGELRAGREECGLKITLACGIGREDCEAVGLSYRDPDSINAADFRDSKRLWIEEGGKWLYELRSGGAADAASQFD